MKMLLAMNGYDPEMLDWSFQQILDTLLADKNSVPVLPATAFAISTPDEIKSLFGPAPKKSLPVHEEIPRQLPAHQGWKQDGI